MGTSLIGILFLEVAIGAGGVADVPFTWFVCSFKNIGGVGGEEELALKMLAR
jgi:hypothetical protein